jgi:hypothetical protein
MTLAWFTQVNTGEKLASTIQFLYWLFHEGTNDPNTATIPFEGAAS